MSLLDIDEEITLEDGLVLRKAARVLGRLGEYTLAQALNLAASEIDAPELCEACEDPATTTDSEGVPLCEPHYQALLVKA